MRKNLLITICLILLIAQQAVANPEFEYFRINSGDTVNITQNQPQLRFLIDEIDSACYIGMDLSIPFFIKNGTNQQLDYLLQTSYFKAFRAEIIHLNTQDTIFVSHEPFQIFNTELKFGNLIPWQALPGETIKIILNTKAHKGTFPGHIAFLQSRIDIAKEHKSQQIVWFFLSFGILLSVVLLSVVFYLATKEKEFRTLIPYLVVVLLYLAFENEFILIPIPGLTAVVVLLAPYFFFVHQRSIINDKVLHKRWQKMGSFIEKYYKYLILVAVVLFFGQFLFGIKSTISLLLNLLLGMGLMSLFFIATFLSYITPVKQYKRKKDKIFVLFIIANTSVLIGIIAHKILQIPGADEAGFVLQSIMFVLIIGEQLRQKNRKQFETTQKLVDQLKVNAQLKEKVNRELEQKVKERTSELAHANEEITAQRDELEAQRNLLDKSNKLLQKQNSEITDSINYASKIQQAAMPAKNVLKQLLTDYFIYFKPRDIVSGDFYWAKQVGEFTFFVAADCTGHGVPGALMSMLGISFLNELVAGQNSQNPAEILNKLRQKVKDTLHQSSGDKGSKDGMDISLGMLNHTTRMLTFAGAYNSAIIISNNQLIELKADRQPIGFYYKEKEFTAKTIELQKNDMFYMFSDGYIDQFGGSNYKKFTRKRFKELLANIANLSTSDQYQLLDKQFKDWKQDEEQIDDIIVMGIRIL